MKIFQKIMFLFIFAAYFLIFPQKTEAQRGITIGKTWHYQSGTGMDCSYLRSSCEVYGGEPVPIQVNYCEDFSGGIFGWTRIPSCACNNACYGCPREGWMPGEFVVGFFL